MKTKIRKIGNSKGVIIPNEFIKNFDLVLNDDVEMNYDGDQITIKPVPLHKELTLKDLFKNYDESYQKEEVFKDDKPIGREEW